MNTVEDRAAAIFKTLALQTASIAASGRYQHSEYIRPGVTYWSTSSDRYKTDLLGVQFTGEDGLNLMRLVRSAFESRGYDVRNPDKDRVTFCKSVPRGVDGRLDTDALQTVKSEIDALLNAPVTVSLKQAPAADFVAFMRASPLAGVELSLPDRSIDADRGAL